MPQIYPVMTTSDIEFLAQYFLTPLLAPTQVSTEVPLSNPNNDVFDPVNGYVRVEAGDVVPHLPFNAMHNASFLAFAYSAQNVGEDQCIALSRIIIDNAAAAGGTTIGGWYINRVLTVMGGKRETDPDMPLLTYRSAVTWEVCSKHP